MAGGLMQLVAYGAQDVYLTGQPKVTFFQAVYKRYTNFAMEAIQQTVNGSSASSSRVSVTVARNGDLVGDMWLVLQPVSSGATLSNNSGVDYNWVAERALADVELTIGGQRIDKHYQAWFRLYAEVFLNEAQKALYGKMTSVPTASNFEFNGQTTYPGVILPLIFFFNRNPGLYLPLIALQYHEVRLDFDLASNYTTYFGSNPVVCWANYVYLDTEERRRFAQKGHEYLIEQVQHTGGDSTTSSASGQTQNLVRLTYNHPVKELIWCYQSSSFPASNPNAMWNFSSNVSGVNVVSAAAVGSNVFPQTIGVPRVVAASNTFSMVEDGADNATQPVGPLSSFKVILNGQDRFALQPGKYFNQYQPYRYHSGCPYAGIYVYSFGLKPEEHQPSGTCNFSRIDNAQVSFTLKTLLVNSNPTQKMFAVNYNILRIQSGMGGLAFSN